MVHYLDAGDQSVEILERECFPAQGGLEYCEVATAVSADDVGPTQTGQHFLHPAMSIRKLSGSSDLELYLSRVEDDYWISCPNNSSGLVWDLASYQFKPDDPVDPFVWEVAVHAAVQQTSECSDHGITELLFDGSTPHACYTNVTDTEERVQCNDYDGSGQYEWGNPDNLALQTGLPPGWETREDHPSFNMGAGGRVVALHKEAIPPFGNNNNHAIEITFPDGTALDLSTANQVRKNFPNTSRNGGVQRVVWEEGDDGDAELKYAECSSNCKQFSSWTIEEITDGSVHKDARQVSHVVDQPEKREFVTFSYDSNTDFMEDPENRVVMGTRCLGDTTWSFEEVRDPPLAKETWDQMLNYGRPSIVLDKSNELVMIAFVEAEEWNNGNFPDFTLDADAIWVRAHYGDLPTCS